MKLRVYTKIVVLEDSSNTYRIYYRVEDGTRELVVSSSNGVLLKLAGKSVTPKTVYEKLKDISEDLAKIAASVV